MTSAPVVKTVETLLECRKFSVQRLSVTGSDGRTRTREVVVHPGAVVVLPVLDDGRVVMLRQYRAAVGKSLLEFPAGTRDVAGESPEACAVRELEEEVGYRADRLELLCSLYPSPGILSEHIIAYVATGLTPTPPGPTADEMIESIEKLTLDDAAARAARGEIEDAKSIVALLMYRLRGGQRA
ncbi:MAG: NUDIX hydrolase [Phycisphaerae bacterium]|nr:NUDIX hydrolase [Phycisphaerae bacterium]NUQ46972.1 NUDIX hydrolase [Phycisphaerae bacterium]